MHISYIPQWFDHVHKPICMPCWMTNPLYILEKENKVLVIHTAIDLPVNIGAAIINEIVVFGRIKTLLYSLTDSSVAVIKSLLTQLGEVEDLLKTNIRYSKDCLRLSNAVKAIEKAPLYINDSQMGVADLITDIHKVMNEVEAERRRYRIVVLDDILSLKGLILNGEINQAEVLLVGERLKQLSDKYKMSFIIMSRRPLIEIYPLRMIQKAYVTIEGKEYSIDTILVD